MEFTNTFWKNVDAKKRYVFNQGGTWSGKTYGELQKEIITALNRKVHISCMSETVPHLRMGMIKDFLEIMISEGLFNPKNWNKTESAYSFDNGSIIEFFSADNAGKVHGGRRDRLLANEIQNISYEIFHQASMRTKEQITADYNPTSLFWVHNKFLDNKDYSNQVDYIHSTYLDNPFIPKAVIIDILTRAKTDENYRRIYIEGMPGSVEGLIFKEFELVDELPKEYKIRVDGQDYGFTNDPTTHITVQLSGGALWYDEVIYEKGLVNRKSSEHPSIEQRLEENKISKSQLIIGDSAEPKTIIDLRRAGYNIRGAIKGKDSVMYGLKGMKQYPMKVTKRSVNLIKELRNYKNVFDKKANEYIDKPEDKWNHCIDAARYATGSIIKPSNVLC
jgi:phage terminase large subunit